MNVAELVINQIRATNGSLWISDVGKAKTAISLSSYKIGLSFETSSVMPFVLGDIIRTKRWGTSGSTTTSVWDVTTYITAVDYANSNITISTATDANYVIRTSPSSW